MKVFKRKAKKAPPHTDGCSGVQEEFAPPLGAKTENKS